MNGISRANMMANLGYWVRTGKAGQGIATAATLLCARFAFEDLGMQRVEISIAIENEASCRVAEKAGATKEGVLRNRLKLLDRQHDAYMYSLIPSELSD